MRFQRLRHCNPARLAGLCLLFAVAGCQSDPPAELAEGQEPYLRHCASCHDNDGSGKPPAFPPLAGSEWLNYGPESVALITLYGLRGEIEVGGRTYRGFMPPMRHLGDAEIADLIGYIGASWADWDEAIDTEAVGALRGRLSRNQPLEGREGLEQALVEIEP